MCVIIHCPNGKRPKRKTLDACAAHNPHGAGVAWRKRGVVHYRKGLDNDELEPLIHSLDGDIVIHYRWASVGKPDPKLCHPFPITPSAPTHLHGKTDRVLFHNGTWRSWQDALKYLPKSSMKRGLVSDTRVAAATINYSGVGALNKMAGKWVVYDSHTTTRYGHWEKMSGMHFSNMNWKPRKTVNGRMTPWPEEKVGNRYRMQRPDGTWTPWDDTQADLDYFSGKW